MYRWAAQNICWHLISPSRLFPSPVPTGGRGIRQEESRGRRGGDVHQEGQEICHQWWRGGGGGAGPGAGTGPRARARPRAGRRAGAGERAGAGAGGGGRGGWGWWWIIYSFFLSFHCIISAQPTWLINSHIFVLYIFLRPVCVWVSVCVSDSVFACLCCVQQRWEIKKWLCDVTEASQGLYLSNVVIHMCESLCCELWTGHALVLFPNKKPVKLLKCWLKVKLGKKQRSKVWLFSREPV